MRFAPYIERSFDASVDGGSGRAQDVRGHERVGGQLAVVLQPRVVTEAAHLNPLVWVHRQQLCGKKKVLFVTLSTAESRLGAHAHTHCVF